MTPPYLKKGDTIGITAPARWIDEKLYPQIAKEIESRGFNIVWGKTTKLIHGPFAGDDNQRSTDMQQMLDEKSINAILCLRGGYGTIRIINNLDFNIFMKNPKWLVGFSDITILHNKLSKLGVESIHGQMPLNFTERQNNPGLDKLFKVLLGNSLHYKVTQTDIYKEGSAEGIITGGNVAILSSLIGTPLDVDTRGKILFIEEVGEYLYRFDRLMYHLKLSGKLQNIAGLIVGGLTEMKDNNPAFGQSAKEIIYDLVKEYDYPVCFDFPAGHIKNNYPLIMGRKATINVKNSIANIKFV